jgi:uncharacterized protein (DUF2141 family)
VASPKVNSGNVPLLDTTTYVSVINYGKLSFSISGFKNNNGYVAVAIFNSQSSFNKGTEPYKVFYKKVISAEIQLSLDSIAYGTYAISVFHDENSNKILDKNFLGIPKEGFGFSNNAKGNFGPPSFEAASFNVNKKDVSISEILLIYF